MVKRQSCLYAMLPLVSVFGILAASWLIAAFLEIFTNNLTMIRILDSTIRDSHIGSDDTIRSHHSNEVLGDKNDRLFWFVQLSDLHLSKFRDYGQQKGFDLLCSTMLRNMKPSLIIVTGDLTDAKDLTLTGSLQYREEWKTYQAMIQQCKQKLPSNTKWLDVRGNHDSFQVPSLRDKWNLYEEYAENKKKFSSGVSSYIHETPYGKYAFTGVDLAPDPGPGRPFNFFAIPSKETLDTIHDFSLMTSNYNGTIWYGHYPLSVTTDPHRLRNMISSGIAYLCGHLHKFPFISNMHAIHNEGFMELELGDWKLNRRFRIGAFDHDIFAFTDQEFSSSSTAVVFTNPVNAKYMVQGKTPIQRMKSSTHIRFLLFRLKPFNGKVEVRINDDIVCRDTKRNGSLNTCLWTTSKYSSGLHRLTVNVLDEDKSRESFSIEFSLDGRRPPLGLLSVIVLLTDFCTMLRMIFLSTVCLVVIIPILIKRSSHKSLDLIRTMIRQYLPYIYHVIDCDVIFWRIIMFNICVTLGPQSIGYFVKDTIGVLFSYGIWSGGNFLPGTLTFLYTSQNLLFFNMITFICVGQILHEQADWRNRKLTIVLSLLFMFWFWYTFRMFWIAYGKMSALTNSLSTWSVPVYMHFLYIAIKLTKY